MGQDIRDMKNNYNDDFTKVRSKAKNIAKCCDSESDKITLFFSKGAAIVFYFVLWATPMPWWLCILSGAISIPIFYYSSKFYHDSRLKAGVRTFDEHGREKLKSIIKALDSNSEKVSQEKINVGTHKEIQELLQRQMDEEGIRPKGDASVYFKIPCYWDTKFTSYQTVSSQPLYVGASQRFGSVRLGIGTKVGGGTEVYETEERSVSYQELWFCDFGIVRFSECLLDKDWQANNLHFLEDIAWADISNKTLFIDSGSENEYHLLIHNDEQVLVRQAITAYLKHFTKTTNSLKTIEGYFKNGTTIRQHRGRGIFTRATA